MPANVLHLIDSFEQGGTERQAVQLVQRLHEHGQFNVRVACLDKRGLLQGEVESLQTGEIPEYRLTSFYDRNALKQIHAFARFLRDQDIRLVHAHGFYTNMFGMAAAKLARVPARIASKRETEGFRTSQQKRVERHTAFRLAHRVVANAEVIRQQLIKEGMSPARVVTIHNGINLERIAPTMNRAEARAYFKLPDERRLITIVANANHPVKDHPTFLQMARRVHEATPDAAFVIAGEGRLLEEYRAVAQQLGIGNSVFFTGQCTRVGDLLELSEVCVLASTAEGFSNSILEYMAASRPVVVTDVGGAREAVEDGITGYLVEAGNADAMARRVIELLHNQERAKNMGQQGRRVVAEKFSSEALLSCTVQLYERLLTPRFFPDSRTGTQLRGDPSL